MEEELRYEPISVRELLRNMKNMSWLMVNLAYSAVIYGDKELAREVLELEPAVDKLDMLLTMQAALATRSARDAEKMVSIFKLAAATNMISDAAADIANIALSRIHIPREVSLSLLHTEEMLVRIEAGEALGGKSIRDFMEDLGVTVDVIAVRRGKRVLLEPGFGFELSRGDTLIIRGSMEAIREIMKYRGEEWSEARPPSYGKYGDIVGDLLQLRNTSLVMVDIAYTAMLTKSEDLGEKVLEFEDYVDQLLEDFELKVLRFEELSPGEKHGALKIAVSSEQIADAAASIVQPLLLGLEPHSIITDVLEETFERISVVEMDESDEGKTLSELGYSKRGVTVLAVRRGDSWIVMPPYSSFRVEKGDVLIVKYTSESEDFVEELEREEAREEIIEDIQEEEWEE